MLDLHLMDAGAQAELELRKARELAEIASELRSLDPADDRVASLLYKVRQGGPGFFKVLGQAYREPGGFDLPTHWDRCVADWAEREAGLNKRQALRLIKNARRKAVRDGRRRPADA